MALNRTIKGLLVKQWTSMMIENSYRQGKEHRLYECLSDGGYTIRAVMDVSQIWSETPQDHEYWSDIANSL